MTAPFQARDSGDLPGPDRAAQHAQGGRRGQEQGPLRRQRQAVQGRPRRRRRRRAAAVVGQDRGHGAVAQVELGLQHARGSPGTCHQSAQIMTCFLVPIQETHQV